MLRRFRTFLTNLFRVVTHTLARFALNAASRPWEGGDDAEQFAPPVLSSVTVQLIKDGLTQHEGGQFAISAQIADHLGRDPDIQQALNQRVLAFLGRPFELKEGTESKAAEMHARETRELWSRMVPQSVISDLLRWAVMLGFAIAQVRWSWDETLALHIPRLECWHPAYVYHDPSTGKWWTATTNGQVEITPGDGRWILYAPNSSQRSYMYAAVRCLPEWFLAAQYARRDANRFSEVRGQGIWVPHLPKGWSSTAEGVAFVQAVKNMGRQPIVAAPRGDTPESSFDLELIESTSDAWSVFDFLLRTSASKIRLVILGQDMTSSEGSSGSFAKSKVGADILAGYTRSDAHTLADCLQAQFFRPWGKYKRDDSAIACKPWWDCREPEELLATAEAQKTAAESVTAWNAATPADSSEVIDAVAYARTFGMPLMPRPAKPKAPVKLPIDSES